MDRCVVGRQRDRIRGAGCGGAIPRAAQPYKLGMFQTSGKPFLGMVVNDSFIVDLSRTFLGLPPTLQELIAVWDAQIASKADHAGTVVGSAGAQLRAPARSGEDAAADR